MKFLKRKLLITLLALVLIIPVLALAALPHLIAYVIEEQLLNYGFVEARVEHVELNPFSRRLMLKQLRAVSSEHRKLLLEELAVDFSVNLPERKITLHRVILSAPVVSMQQSADGHYTITADHKMPENNSAAQIEPVHDELAEKNIAEPEVWRIIIDVLELRQVEFYVSDLNAENTLDLKFNFALEKLVSDTSGLVELKKLMVDGLVFNANSRAVTTLKQLDINVVNMNNEMLSVDAVGLQGLSINVLRMPGGDLFLQDVINAFKPETDSQQVDTENVNPLQWRLGGISLSGENTVHVVDQNIKPSLDMNFAINSFQLGAVDSTQPQTPVSLGVEAVANKYSSLVIAGELKPLTAGPGMRLNTEIKQLDISPYSAYVSQVIGYKIKTGQLNLSSELQIEDKQLGSKNALHINKFSVEVADPDKAKVFEKDINMSFDSALYFIRDKNDDIKLDIPINGSIDDPDFELASVIRAASSKALRGATMTYLKFTLQPWGALFMLGEKIGEKAGQIRFEPVKFNSGEALLTEEMQSYIVKLSELMNKKKKLRLSLCPVTTSSDRGVLLAAGVLAADADKRLSTLATERAQAVKDYFVDAHGIDPERLFICPADEDRENDLPRVIIEM